MNSKQMRDLGIIEVYLPIDGFENYAVSNYGNVKNTKTNKIIKSTKNIHGYLFVNLYDSKHKSINKRVHRLVLATFEKNPESKPCIDHINNDKLDNCLFNLRYVTYQENNFNAKLSKRNTSGVKGISWHKLKTKWIALIMIDGKLLHLGYFDNLEDAKIARNNKAIELFGEYKNSCEN
jgi:hypothetical protein